MDAVNKIAEAQIQRLSDLLSHFNQLTSNAETTFATAKDTTVQWGNLRNETDLLQKRTEKSLKDLAEMDKNLDTVMLNIHQINDGISQIEKETAFFLQQNIQFQNNYHHIIAEIGQVQTKLTLALSSEIFAENLHNSDKTPIHQPESFSEILTWIKGVESKYRVLQSHMMPLLEPQSIPRVLLGDLLMDPIEYPDETLSNGDYLIDTQQQAE